MRATETARRPKRRPAPTPKPADGDGRLRILEAAIQSFASTGYDGTTTASVARNAEVTQPLVHHHFGSKEGLWRAAVDHLFARLAVVETAGDARGRPEDRLLDATLAFVEVSADHPEIVRILAREGTSPSPRLTYLLDHFVRGPMKAAVQAFREGQRTGLLAQDVRPELAIFFILGAGSHLFDVAALAQEGLGIDVRAKDTRAAFAHVFRRVLTGGLVTAGAR